MFEERCISLPIAAMWATAWVTGFSGVVVESYGSSDEAAFLTLHHRLGASYKDTVILVATFLTQSHVLIPTVEAIHRRPIELRTRLTKLSGHDNRAHASQNNT